MVLGLSVFLSVDLIRNRLLFRLLINSLSCCAARSCVFFIYAASLRMHLLADLHLWPLRRAVLCDFNVTRSGLFSWRKHCILIHRWLAWVYPSMCLSLTKNESQHNYNNNCIGINEHWIKFSSKPRSFFSSTGRRPEELMSWCGFRRPSVRPCVCASVRLFLVYAIKSTVFIRFFSNLFSGFIFMRTRTLLKMGYIRPSVCRPCVRPSVR